MTNYNVQFTKLYEIEASSREEALIKIKAQMDMNDNTNMSSSEIDVWEVEE